MDATLETLSLSFPADDLKLVKELAKKFGWKLSRKKKTGIEEALDDIKQGRIYGPYTNAEEMFKAMGVKHV
jgi:hypothetical protein